MGYPEDAPDGLAAYRATNIPTLQKQIELLAGIHDATRASAGSNAQILAGITQIRDDPTGKNTLNWTRVAATIAFLALLAAIVVPAVQFSVEEHVSEQREKEAELQHADDQRKLDMIRVQLEQEHVETVNLEKALVKALTRSETPR